MWVLDLNDARTRVWQDDRLVYSEPAVAMISKQAIITGSSAVAKCRLEPAQFYSKFVDKFNQESISAPSKMIAHQADLLYELLCSTKKACRIPDRDSVWIAVTSDATPSQLSLLYGVAKAAGIAVRDFVDRAMAMSTCSLNSGEGAFLHLGMHRTVVSHFQVNGGLCRNSVHAFAEPGFLRFLNTWLQVVTNRFLQASRFDPRRFGDTEQQVFDRLWKFANGQAELGIFDVSYQGETRQAEVSATDLAMGSENTYASLSPHLDRVSTLLAEDYVLSLPGMRQFLHSLDIEPIEVQPEMIVKGIQAITPPSESSSVDRRFHVDFPTPSPSDHDEYIVEATEPLLPTHLLHGSTAVALHEIVSPATCFEGISPNVDFQIICENGMAALAPGPFSPVALNETAVHASAPLSSGDVIDAGGHRFHCISVIGDG